MSRADLCTDVQVGQGGISETAHFTRHRKKIQYRAPSRRDFFSLFKAVTISITNLFCVQLFNLIFRDLNFSRARDVGSKCAPGVPGGLEGVEEARKGRSGTQDREEGHERDFVMFHVEKLPVVSSLFISLPYRSGGRL